MKKMYLIDVSRRLLILVLLLCGYITQMQAAPWDVDRKVYVFWDLPQTATGLEAEYGLTLEQILNQSGAVTCYQSGFKGWGDMEPYWNGNSKWSDIKDKPLLDVLTILELESEIPFQNCNIQAQSQEVKGATAVMASAKSGDTGMLWGEPKRYYLRIGTDGTVKDFNEFKDVNDFLSVAQIHAVTKNVTLPGTETFSVVEGTDEAKIANLKSELQKSIEDAIDISSFTVSDLKIEFSGSPMGSDLKAGTYDYSFSLEPVADIKLAMEAPNAAGVSPEYIEATNVKSVSKTEFKVTGAIQVAADVAPVSLFLPVKDKLSFFEGEYTVAGLGKLIYDAIEDSISKLTDPQKSEVSIASVQILKGGSPFSGASLSAGSYGYSFEMTIGSTQDNTYNFYRTNTQSATIEPNTVTGAGSKTVKVFRSIEIKPVIDLTVFKGELGTADLGAASIFALQDYIQSELTKKIPAAYKDALEIRNVKVTPASTDAPLLPGSYNYKFDIVSESGEVKITIASDATPKEAIIKSLASRTFTVKGQVTIVASELTDGTLEFPQNWGNYTYGTPISNLLDKITMNIDGVSKSDVSLYLEKDGVKTLYTENSSWEAGDYNVILELPSSNLYTYKPTTTNCSRTSDDGVTYYYKSNYALKVKQQPINGTIFPVFADGVGGLGKLANGINLANTRKSILNNINPSNFVEKIEVYSDASFTNEITSGKLTPGATYSYRVILKPNYTKGSNVSASVGGVGCSFNTAKNSYDIVNAIAIDKATLTISLPAYITSPIKIGKYANNKELTDDLVATIREINPQLDENVLVPEVSLTGGNVSSVTDGSYLGYKVTIKGDLSQIKLNFVTIESPSIEMVAKESECTLNNSLLFNTQLPTEHNLILPGNYKIPYEKDMKPKAIIDQVKKDLLLLNAGSLGKEKYSIRLINNNLSNKSNVTESDETFGYKVTITKSDNLKEILTKNNPSIIVKDEGETIVITFVASISIVPRPVISFNFGEYTIPFVPGLNKTQVAEKVRDYLYIDNPMYAGYIESVTITDNKITEMMGKATYRVKLSDDVDVEFSEIKINGVTNSGLTYEGGVNITPRQVATVKLSKYEFKKEGASKEMIEKAILADLLLKNDQMMGAYISSVNLLGTFTPDVYSYLVRFKPNSAVRQIIVRNADGGILLTIDNPDIYGAYALYLSSVSLTENGQSLATYPLIVNVELPFITRPFGMTAEEYAQDLLDNFKLTKGSPNMELPNLNMWGVKNYLIKNQTQADGEQPEQIALDSYPTVSDLYGYQVISDANTQFSKYYKLVYKDDKRMHLITNDYNNDVIAKLAFKIVKAEKTVTLPTVGVTYNDINTKAALLDSIKKDILADPANKEFFELVAKTGVKPINSFKVSITTSIAEEGTVLAGTYKYSVTFVQKVTDNIEVSEDGLKKLVVSPAEVEFIFPTDMSYRYGKRKKAIELDILSSFLAANSGLLSSYSCFENPADLFKVELKSADCQTEVTDNVPSAGDYGYTVLVLDPNLLSNFKLTDQFGSNFHNVLESVTIGLKKLTVTLPTYLASEDSKDNLAAKAAFVFGKMTKADIEDQIQEDILALNPKLTSANIKSIALMTKVAQKENPQIGDYDYTVQLVSSDYTFVYAIDNADVTTKTDDTPQVTATAVAAVKVIAPGIAVTFKNEKLIGHWTIENGTPEYKLDLELGEEDYGFKWVTISENPEGPTAMTQNRWNQLFKSNKLHWALFKNDKVRFHGNTLNSVLIDSIKHNVTENKFTLRIIDPTTLKAAVGNFDITLDVALATVTVKPAVVEVRAAANTYTKEYGVEVTKASDLKNKLEFTTDPVLNPEYKQLLPDKNVIDIFGTVLPVGENVYAADALVGDYKIHAIDEVLKGMLTPVVGVRFAASETQSTVKVEPKTLYSKDLTITVSASREYGEDLTNADIHVAVTGKELSEAFRSEIEGLLNGDNVDRVSWFDQTGINKKTDVGTYELRFTSKSEGAFKQIEKLLPNFKIFEGSLKNAGLTITKAPLTVRAQSYSRPYGAGNPSLEIEYIGLKNNEYENLADVFSVMPKVATDARADSRGTYDIYFTVEGVARNYDVTHEKGTLSIDKIRRTIVWPENQRNLVIQVGETVELSAYLKSEADGKPSISDLRYELSGNDRERVVLSEVSRGVYAVTGMVRTEGDKYVTITVSADGDDTYEASAPVTGTIKVVAPDGDAAKVNVIVSNVISVYDGNPRAVSVKVTDSDSGEAVKDFSIYYEGDQFGEIPTLYPSTQDAPTEAGVYSVTVKASLGSVTYQYTAKNKMVIAPKPVVVTARSFNIKYGDELPSYTNAYDYNKKDFLNGEDFKVNQAPIVRIEGYNGKAGIYKLTPYSAQDFGRNYVITYVSGQLTINKAALTIQADPKESVYGKDLEELTYTATGFVNGETLKNLGFAPRISSTVTRTSDAGNYPITFSDNYTSDNYEVSYIDGEYVILPASQKITWRPETVLDVEDGDVYLTATASSNLPVVFNSANDAVAYVNQIGDTWILTPVSSGTLTVTAMQHGNKNYNAAEPVTVTFIVDGEYLSVGNEKITASDHIEVYPRLFTHSVTVAAPSEIKQVELLTMSGVLQHVISKPGSVIDLSSFGPGIYLLNVTLEDGTFKSVKIIKK